MRYSTTWPCQQISEKVTQERVPAQDPPSPLAYHRCDEHLTNDHENLMPHQND
jgi:hypothetical protein